MNLHVFVNDSIKVQYIFYFVKSLICFLTSKHDLPLKCYAKRFVLAVTCIFIKNPQNVIKHFLITFCGSALGFNFLHFFLLIPTFTNILNRNR